MPLRPTSSRSGAGVTLRLNIRRRACRAQIAVTTVKRLRIPLADFCGLFLLVFAAPLATLAVLFAPLAPLLDPFPSLLPDLAMLLDPLPCFLKPLARFPVSGLLESFTVGLHLLPVLLHALALVLHAFATLLDMLPLPFHALALALHAFAAPLLLVGACRRGLGMLRLRRSK